MPDAVPLECDLLTITHNYSPRHMWSVVHDYILKFNYLRLRSVSGIRIRIEGQNIDCSIPIIELGWLSGNRIQIANLIP